MADQSNHDYSTGELRRHHELYIKDGNIVIQVEKAIINVHRSVIAKYSPVIEDMLNEPDIGKHGDGSDEKPLVLTGDSVVGWELLFKLQYESPRISCDRLSGHYLLQMLPLAHKYCMEKIEADIIKELKKTSTHDDLVDLVVAASIVNSEELRQEAIQRIVAAGALPTIEQARRMGLEVTHAIMLQIRKICSYCKVNPLRCYNCENTV